MTVANALAIAGIAFAVGLDIFAVSIALGIAGLRADARIRIGLTFSAAEVTMMIIGYVVGSGFQVVGEVAPYIGFAVLIAVGVYMIVESYKEGAGFKVDSHAGLATTAMSVSLDSLGVGFALPAVRLPFPPLIATVACTTVVFTFAGLAFGARLGSWIEEGAERIAGAILIILGILFGVQHALSGGL